MLRLLTSIRLPTLVLVLAILPAHTHIRPFLFDRDNHGRHSVKNVDGHQRLRVQQEV